MAEPTTRQSLRLPGYDYSQAGGYFVTFYTQGWVHLFGQINSGEILMNDLGYIVQRIWLGLPNHYAGIGLGEYIVMPNHFHGIIFVNGMIKTKSGLSLSRLVGGGLKPPPTSNFKKNEHSNNDGSPHSLSEIIRALKTFSAREINKINSTPGRRVWHKEYFDRIIRNEAELNRIHLYIETNPQRFG
jgi:REP element-mobilizing transposase RayT